MKVVRVRIRRGDPKVNDPKTGKPETQMMYPDRFDAIEVDRYGLAASGVNGAVAHSGKIGLGGIEEHQLIILPDALAAEYVDADPTHFDILNNVQADAIMETWREDQGYSETIVRNPELVTAIINKQAAGITLTAEELAALDPDDRTPGINKNRRDVADVIAERFEE